jgi:hypothetical protein
MIEQLSRHLLIFLSASRLLRTLDSHIQVLNGYIPVQIPSVLMSLRTKARIFSDIFRSGKTKVAQFTSQFLNNYRLKLYTIQAHTIKEARMSLESLNNQL